jgi:hypothetical protein
MDHLPGDIMHVGDSAADAADAMHPRCVCPAGVLLLLGALDSANTSPAASQQQKARSSSTSSFAPWQEPQQQHIQQAARASSRSKGPSLQEHAALSAPQQQQQQQRVRQRNQQMLRGTPSSITIPNPAFVPHPIVSSVWGSSLRSLQQSANVYQPPKFFLSNVKATVVNTYEWQISRQGTAGGVTITADGQERQQMGE